MESNNSLKANRNILVFEYFVVFLLIFYAAKANLFVLAIENWDDPIGLLLPIISFTVLGFLKGVQLTYKYWMFVLGFSLYFLASTIKFGELHPRFFLINIINFTFAYVLVSGLRFRFFRIYEDILYYLCIIALCFWLIQNLIPDTFIEFLRNFEFSRQPEIKGNVDYNTIIYTVSNFEYSSGGIKNFGNVRIFRNSGYAWEPGAFASFINIAIFFNLIRNRFNLKGNKHFWVFVVALASTFSTTGYSIFILLLLFYIYNQDIIKAVWLVPIFVVATLFLFTLPFMTEKIASHTEYNTEELIYLSAKYNNKYQPQRFQSLQIDFIDFLNHPIIGYGGHLKAKWTTMLGAQIATVSGIGKVLAQFGIIGFTFFIFSLWLSSKQIITLFKIKGTIFPVLFVLMVSISYSVLTTTYFCIWLLYLSSFLKIETLRKYIIYSFLENSSSNHIGLERIDKQS